MDYLQKAYIANLNAVCREGGHFSLQPGQSWAIHDHTATFNKFYYLLSGSCQITVEDRCYTARAGDWFFIPAGTRHSYDHDSLPRLLQLPHRICVDGHDKSKALFETLTAVNSSNTLTDKLHAKVALLSLITRYVELSHAKDLPVLSEEDSRIGEVLTYIHKHLAEPLNNQTLADLCHLHPNHFIRFFSGKTGQSPASYLLKCRMDLARQLLIETDLPVLQIAERVGIPDQSHFARLFRRCFEMTPSQCRKLHQA